ELGRRQLRLDFEALGPGGGTLALAAALATSPGVRLAISAGPATTCGRSASPGRSLFAAPAIAVTCMLAFAALAARRSRLFRAGRNHRQRYAAAFLIDRKHPDTDRAA